ASDTGTAGDNRTSDPTITYPTAASGNLLLYKLDTGSYSTTAPTFATDGSADGSHTVSIKEQDAAGNISGASSLTFTLDTTAPPTPAPPVPGNHSRDAGHNPHQRSVHHLSEPDLWRRVALQARYRQLFDHGADIRDRRQRGRQPHGVDQGTRCGRQ